MKDELACASFPVEYRHLIGDSLHIPLPESFARCDSVQCRNTAICAVAITAAAAHQITGRRTRDPIDRSATVGKRQRVQVIQHTTRLREANSSSLAICDAGDLR